MGFLFLKDSANEKPWLIFFFSPKSSQFPFPIYENIRLPLLHGGLVHGLQRWPTLNCNPLLILNKSIFAGEISRKTFASGQHFAGPVRDQKRPWRLQGWWTNRCGSHNRVHFAHCFFHWPWNLKHCLSFASETSFPPFEALHTLFGINLKIFFFLLVKVLFGTLDWF